MELFKHDANVDFMGSRNIAVAISVAIFLAAVIVLSVKGLSFALDFTGGTFVEVKYAQAPVLDDVRSTLAEAGYPDAVVQTFGAPGDLAIRLAPKEDRGDSRELGEKVLATLKATNQDVSLSRSEFVGPQVGKELAQDGLIAVLVVVIGLLGYVAARFQGKFAVAAIAGQIFDITVTVGFISLLDREFDLTVLAAVLAVVGYSINDKIVVFDRIREMFRSTRQTAPIDVLNQSVNITLSRTIMTSFTTLLSVIALFVLGGPALEGFALTLIIGIIVGTLSSVFLASPLLMMMKVTKRDLMPRARDVTELERRP